MLQTIDVSYNPAEAASIRAMLAASGIGCHLANAQFGQVTFHYLVATQGVEIQVPAADTPGAARLLAAFRAVPSTLESQSSAFRRRFLTLGLLSLVLSLMTAVLTPIWTRARRFLEPQTAAVTE